MIHRALASGSSHTVVSLSSTVPQGRRFRDSSVEPPGSQKTQAGMKSVTHPPRQAQQPAQAV